MTFSRAGRFKEKVVNNIIRKPEVAELTRIMTKTWIASGHKDDQCVRDIKDLNARYSAYVVMRGDKIVKHITRLINLCEGEKYKPMREIATQLLEEAETQIASGETTTNFMRGFMGELRRKYTPSEG
jgi:hypothetical protein